MPETTSVYPSSPPETPSADHPPATTEEDGPSAQAQSQGVLSVLREWCDALMIAFVLAMFIRVFMLELFKIPTGSMTPTLIGGSVVSIDYNEDGLKDLVLVREMQRPLLFLRDGRRLVPQGEIQVSPADVRRWEAEGAVQQQHDRILVNKLAYWFRNPQRGEIVVFKVPEEIWTIDKPIYIKRVVGLPGERLTFDRQGRLQVDDVKVTQPEFFEGQRYQTRLADTPDLERQSGTTYRGPILGSLELEQIRVPLGEIYAFGDNTNSSRDSRYWGGVPLANLKGRAFFRYWPFDQVKFL